MTTASGLRCSALSAIDEPLPGSAAHVRGWLCVEHPGPWGRDVLDDQVLGSDISAELGRRTAAADVRLMVIRRPGRATGGHTVLLANSRPDTTWCERLEIDDYPELLDLDLTAISGAAPGIGTTVEDPVVLVCAHGKRDQCCALYGRPVAAQLAAKFPAAVWECSHTGGHRFAPSVIVLPTGYSYGRLDATASAHVVEAAMRGKVALPGLRGRSCYRPAAQAAEVAVRDLTGDTDISALAVGEQDSGVLVAHRDGRSWWVEVGIEKLVPRAVSCGAKPKPVEVVRVREIRELPHQ
ncbi:sucrase ferredoxin [Skermania sp. ID1734]|uniref:sucrase ferredoxin n=1 Tax=Skermania sp. ID1734 TaxID=2597516 RepID=UPI00117C52A4|nr:sucrase ferredoxin [Skermania sp. ID1734]TSE02067.1 sucrase ferredoxin [Skermania sp. ID1734]